MFLLGAREIRGDDQSSYFESASQEAYKLSLQRPKIYVYEGVFERGYVLQNNKNISLVLDRSFLNRVSKNELSGVCFALLIQAKHGLATNRTKAMLIFGSISWIVNGLGKLLGLFIPSRYFRLSINWFLVLMFYPLIQSLFSMMVGNNYLIKAFQLLDEYPDELRNLKLATMKLKNNSELYSITSRKLIEIASASKTSTYKNTLTLDVLPHEWDEFYIKQDKLSVAEN